MQKHSLHAKSHAASLPQVATSSSSSAGPSKPGKGLLFALLKKPTASLVRFTNSETVLADFELSQFACILVVMDYLTLFYLRHRTAR